MMQMWVFRWDMLSGCTSSGIDTGFQYQLMCHQISRIPQERATSVSKACLILASTSTYKNMYINSNDLASLN